MYATLQQHGQPPAHRTAARRARPGAGGSRAEQVLALQRAAGNRAVTALLTDLRAPASSPGTTDGRGLEDEGPTDDRTTGALVGGGLGALVGGVVGGPVGALVGGLGGALLGGTIGELMDAASQPLPVALRNGPGHRPIDEPATVGMSIDVALTSSTGVDADMASVEDSEQVSASLRHTGSYTSVPPGRSNNSGYMPGYPIPPDRHGEPRARVIDLADNHGGDGTMDREQLDTYRVPSAGIGETVVPASGYLIRRIITVSGTTITFRLQKSPQAVTVNGFTTTAGPSPTQWEDVVVRA